MRVSLQEIVDLLDESSDESRALLNRKTGKTAHLSEDDFAQAEAGEGLDHLPDWQREQVALAAEIDGSRDWVALPSQFDIHDYEIMRRFCMAVEDAVLRGEMLTAIQGRGAFRRFEEMIDHHDLTESWHRFRIQALAKIAEAWLRENSIPFSDDIGSCGPWPIEKPARRLGRSGEGIRNDRTRHSA